MAPGPSSQTGSTCSRQKVHKDAQDQREEKEESTMIPGRKKAKGKISLAGPRSVTQGDPSIYKIESERGSKDEDAVVYQLDSPSTLSSATAGCC